MAHICKIMYDERKEDHKIEQMCDFDKYFLAIYIVSCQILFASKPILSIFIFKKQYGICYIFKVKIKYALIFLKYLFQK